MGWTHALVPGSPTVGSLIFLDGDSDNDIAGAAIVDVVLASQFT